MPRRRTKDLHLPPRVYLHRAGYRYHPPGGGQKVPLGRDLGEALKKYAAIIQGQTWTNGPQDTVGALIEWYLANIHITAPDNSPDTIADKTQSAKRLTEELGHIPLKLLRPFHVRDYLDLGIREGRAVRVNREKALLSHACTVAMGKGWIDVNPCRGVVANKEKKRERYIEDHEVQAVLAVATPIERAVAMLIYRTLQRPKDILGWTAANIIEREGKKILRVKQSKTGATVDIAYTDEIDAIYRDYRQALADQHAQLKRPEQRRHQKTLAMTLLYNRSMKRYTESGLKAMWNKSCKAAGVADFGIYDMKGKGATDLYQGGVPIEVISALCGHQSVTTTETYIKARMRAVIQPNKRKVG